MKVCVLREVSDEEGDFVMRYAAPPSADVPRTMRAPGRRRMNVILGVLEAITSHKAQRRHEHV